ncbi:MAG TPA: glycan-binding surface protein [Puia sp.]|nr:glycan-binding surface protein [Puia sp.]
MKNIIYTACHWVLTAVTACLLISQAGCKKNSGQAAPVITSIRNYAASPADSLVHKIGPGQWIVISGHNLKGAAGIYFDGVAASFNDALFSDTSAVVLIPSVIAFPSVPAKSLNTITYVTTHGQTVFSFSILPPAPTISSISNENANAGDTVTIYGLNFFFIQGLSFAGTSIASYTANSTGTSVSFVLPTLSQSGPVSITTNSGSATTLYNVNDVETGMLCNFDDINSYSWGAYTTTNSTTLFPDGKGNYAQLYATNIGANDFSWYNGGRGLNTNAVQWVPASELADTVAHYAVKFEMNVPASWNGGTLFIAANYTWTYIARYAPWLNADGSTTAFTTSGWQTVTIPFSSFKTKSSAGYSGEGLSLTSFTDLLGASGNTSLHIWLINDAASSIASFDAAIDNIRVEKIQ